MEYSLIAVNHTAKNEKDSVVVRGKTLNLIDGIPKGETVATSSLGRSSLIMGDPSITGAEVNLPCGAAD